MDPDVIEDIISIETKARPGPPNACLLELVVHRRSGSADQLVMTDEAAAKLLHLLSDVAKDNEWKLRDAPIMKDAGVH